MLSGATHSADPESMIALNLLQQNHSCPGLVLAAAGFIPTGPGLAGLDVDGGHLHLLPPSGNLSLERCALFDSVPGPPCLAVLFCCSSGS